MGVNPARVGREEENQMDKIKEALDSFLRHIRCADRRTIEARKHLKKFRQIKDSMSPEELRQLKAVFSGKKEES